MNDVDVLCDRVAFMAHGKIAEIDTPKSLKLKHGERRVEVEFKKDEQLIKKVFSYAKIFKEIELNFFWLIGAVILISFFHSLLGFLLTYYSKDFTQLLMGMMKYSFVFIIPVLLEQIGLITNEWLVKLLYTIPTKASMILLNGATGAGEIWEIVVSLLYLLIISIGVFFIVLKKHDEFSLKESGV